MAKKQNLIYFGTFLYTPTIQAGTSCNFDADLKNLNLQRKTIFWGFAYQCRQSGALFEKAVVTSSWSGDRVAVTVYNGHNTTFAIPVICVAFAT